MFIYIDRMIIHCLDNPRSVQKRDCPVGGMEAGRELEVLQCVCLDMANGFWCWKVRICLCVQEKELNMVVIPSGCLEVQPACGKTKQWFYHQHHSSGVTD